MNYFRKKNKIIAFTYSKNTSDQLKIIVNNKPLNYFKKNSLQSAALDQVIRMLPPGTYNLKTKGGGLGSLKEVLGKKLYTCLEPKNKIPLKAKYITLTKTAIRRIQPKKAGGKKARARFQKSYR